MAVQKYECPNCHGVQEMRSNEYGNVLTHVRRDWQHNEQTSVPCFTEALPTPELTYEQIMERIDQIDARLKQLEEREAARTAVERAKAEPRLTEDRQIMQTMIERGYIGDQP